MVVDVVGQFKKEQGQCLHFLYTWQMQMSMAHQRVLQGGTVLFRLFCLGEDGMLPTDSVYRVLLCIRRHDETMVRHLIVSLLS